MKSEGKKKKNTLLNNSDISYPYNFRHLMTGIDCGESVALITGGSSESPPETHFLSEIPKSTAAKVFQRPITKSSTLSPSRLMSFDHHYVRRHPNDQVSTLPRLVSSLQRNEETEKEEKKGRVASRPPYTRSISHSAIFSSGVQNNTMVPLFSARGCGEEPFLWGLKSQDDKVGSPRLISNPRYVSGEKKGQRSSSSPRTLRQDSNEKIGRRAATGSTSSSPDEAPYETIQVQIEYNPKTNGVRSSKVFRTNKISPTPPTRLPPQVPRAPSPPPRRDRSVDVPNSSSRSARSASLLTPQTETSLSFTEPQTVSREGRSSSPSSVPGTRETVRQSIIDDFENNIQELVRQEIRNYINTLRLKDDKERLELSVDDLFREAAVVVPTSEASKTQVPEPEDPQGSVCQLVRQSTEESVIHF
ncbi:unnamed protein product [Caenorhabditis auriculariae]|uniref:Uncharacterized protein n=1 Tax=Caenorhabditis auriculariae TaxID=2777116 RepID=A0A8S1GWW7_9PELO|nr:unnamed protein product [Caenorhabditis auriculariae]